MKGVSVKEAGDVPPTLPLCFHLLLIQKMFL
jgi:hypothetical protein